MKSKEERIAIRNAQIAEVMERVEARKAERFIERISGKEIEFLQKRILAYLPTSRMEEDENGELVIFTGLKAENKKLYPLEKK